MRFILGRLRGELTSCINARRLGYWTRGTLTAMTLMESYRAYLVTAGAEFLRCSVRTIHELTRRRAIQHRRVAGTRRCLFVPRELHE